jgi:cyclopropane fatty-acyl-phospholipid synthase-like methyltransferase
VTAVKYVDMDLIYQKVPLDRIPWHLEAPPDALVELVDRGTIGPCKTVDLGCGAGTCAIYFASMGFEVTGVDSSPTAIEIARKRAGEKGLACEFIVADLLGDMHEVTKKFDFAYDWELLHHIFPEDRPQYVQNVFHLLNPEARYFSLSFSEKDPQFGGTGKFRKTPLGTTLYFSSESEIRDLLSPYFVIQELKTIEISGKFGSHYAVSTLSIRR